jgi:hypothetical protein
MLISSRETIKSPKFISFVFIFCSADFASRMLVIFGTFTTGTTLDENARILPFGELHIKGSFDPTNFEITIIGLVLILLDQDLAMRQRARFLN